MQEIRENTSFVLAKVCKANRGHVGALLAEHGLHIGQEMLLVELWQDDGLRSGELAVRLGVEPPTITRMLRRLEGCSIVERRPDPTDARSFRVHLTGGDAPSKGRSPAAGRKSRRRRSPN